MPIYEFQCDMCGAKTEILYKGSDQRRDEIPCDEPECDFGVMQRIISKNEFRLVGDGWERDGYS